MNKTFKFLPLVAASAVLAGCQDYDLGFDAKEIAYKQSFEKAFGKVDPNQNWDLYGQLMAGENGGTRANVESSIGDFVIVDNLTPVELTDAQVKQYTVMMPEERDANQPYSKTNLGRVTQNFTAKVNELTLYPIFWCTSGTDEIGLYYYAEEGTTGAVNVKGEWIVRIPITENKKNLEKIKWTGRGYEEQNDYEAILNEEWDALVQYNPEKYVEIEGSKWVMNGTEKEALNSIRNHQGTTFKNSVEDDMVAVSNGKYVLDEWHVVSIIVPGTCTYESFTGDDVSTCLTTNAPSVRSTGTKVTFPKTTQIGMYIKQNSYYMYSEYKLNNKVTFNGESEGRDVSYVATYQLNNEDGTPILDENDKKIQYLCFEDWFEDDNFDLNDCVFRVFGLDENTIVDHDNYTEEALLVCEDLGDDDFDFNDVVLKLSYINAITKEYHYTNGVVTSVDATNNESIKVTPMAAGGANESTVTIHPAGAVDASSDYQWGEIHALLNGSAPSIINAAPEFGGEGQSLALPVATYGATWNKADYPTYLSMLYDKGFIKITSSGENAKAITSTNSYSESGEVPQMMLLPVNFEWPQERTYIVDAYSEFKNWVGDASATSWINTRDRSKVTKRNVIVTPSEPELPSVPEPVEPSDNDGLVLTISSGLSMTFDNTTEPQSIIASCATDGATISFSIDTDDAATVSPSGVVTPVANGSATITVTVSCDGYESVSKDVTVTVSNYPVAYGTLIESSSFTTSVGALNGYAAYKLEAIPSGKTLKVTLVQKGDNYVQVYCYDSDYSDQSTINGQKETAKIAEFNTNSINSYMMICIQQGQAANADIYYSFE